MDKRVAVL